MATTVSTRRQFLSLLGLSAVAVSCGTATGATSGKGQTKTLRYQGAAGQVTLPELAEDLGYLEDVKLKWVGNTISGPQDIQSAATDQVDFGGAFNGAVVKLAANKAPVKAVISYYGSDKYAYNGFYVLKDSPIHSARDVIGKKVGMNTLGAHSEAMLDIYLQRGGLSRAEIGKAEPLVVPPVNTEQTLRQKQIDVAVLGGILRDKALAAGGIRPLFTDYQLLGAFSAGDVRDDGPLLEAEPRHGPDLRHRRGPGHRVVPFHTARRSHRPDDGHREEAWPQRGHGTPEVLAVLWSRRDGLLDHRQGTPVVDRLAG